MASNPFVVFVIVVLGHVLGSGSLGTNDFGYGKKNGPLHWANSYSFCAGELQSPIDIEEKTVKPVRLSPLIFRGFHSVPKSMSLSNNGHTVKLEVSGSPLPTLSGGPLAGPYAFSQLHFHWGANDSTGSEDLINNQSFPMELHMVFYKMEYGDVDMATNFKDGLCVLAVFYELYDFNNSAYSEIIEHLSSVREPNTKSSLKAFLTLDDLLPTNKHLYYTYNGSLTTPPCYEVVTWLNFKEPIPLSHYQMGEFRKLRSMDGIFTGNFRPVQPLGNRTVLLNVGEKPVQSKHHEDKDDYENGNDDEDDDGDGNGGGGNGNRDALNVKNRHESGTSSVEPAFYLIFYQAAVVASVHLTIR